MPLIKLKTRRAFVLFGLLFWGGAMFLFDWWIEHLKGRHRSTGELIASAAFLAASGGVWGWLMSRRLAMTPTQPRL